jgi:hypothetical protein
MWWWDATGIWTINAFIQDLSGNTVSNNSATFSIGATNGVLASPSFINWSQIAPSATNALANNDPLLMNNTGNQNRNINVNATDLVGETTPSKALYAENFSVNSVDGCEGTAMVKNVYTNVAGSNLPKGNYTKSDGTGQEQLYFCMEAANSDLTAQYYSTSSTGAWTAQISA